MANICLIGAGSLGARHLQGLSNLENTNNIYVIDPSKEALLNAEQLFNEMPNSNKQHVNFLTGLNSIPSSVTDLDIVIVATNSSVRRKMIEDAVAQFQIKYFILEKVLFQRLDDFNAIEKLLEDNGIKAWVNCPRRYFEIYKTIKKDLCNEDYFEMHVSGVNWGLACNAIHFIDLAAYLGGVETISIDTSKLDDRYIESKRSGYLEVTGIISGEIGKCKNFSLASYEKGNRAASIDIVCGNRKYIIFENIKKYYVQYDMGEFEEFSFVLPYQSQLTNIEVEDILQKGTCCLTEFKESVILHKPLINELIIYFQNRGLGGELCPIT